MLLDKDITFVRLLKQLAICVLAYKWGRPAYEKNKPESIRIGQYLEPLSTF